MGDGVSVKVGLSEAGAFLIFSKNGKQDVSLSILKESKSVSVTTY